MRLAVWDGVSRRASVCIRRFGFALLTSTALCPVGAFAQSSQSGTTQTGVVSYSVPAGALGTAISRFGDRSNLQVLYPTALVRGKQSPGVSGAMTREQALSRILAGTGLTYSFTGASTVTIIDPNANGNSAAATVDGAIALDTIDVSGGGGAGAQAAADLPYQTPGTSAYISSEDIQRISPTSNGDIFKGTPGVTVAGNRSSGPAIDINIRGLQGQNRVNTMVDGAMQQSSTYRGYRGSDSRVYVDPELIGGVSVETGPSSGAHGAGVIGGIVNMRTLEASDILLPGKTYGARVRGLLSSGAIDRPNTMTVSPRTDNDDLPDSGRTLASFATAYMNDRYEVVAAFSRRKEGNYFAGTHGPTSIMLGIGRPYQLSVYGYGEEVFNTSQLTTSGLAKGKLKFENGHTFEIGYVNFSSEYGERYPDLSGTKSEGQLNDALVHTYTARYSWKPSDNDLVDLRANVWASDANTIWRDYDMETNSFSWGGEIHNTSRFDLPLGSLKWNYGGQFFKEDSGSENWPDGTISVSNSNGTRSMHSAFTQLQYDVTRWLRLDGGIRYDHYELEADNPASPVQEKEGSAVNPTGSITVTPIDGLHFFVKYAEGFRPPSVREAFSMSPQVRPNPLLAPENSISKEYGVNVVRDGFLSQTDRLRLKMAYFNNTYEDYIARMEVGQAGLPADPSYPLQLYPFAYGNIPEAIYKGIELSGSYDARWMFVQFGFNRYTDVTYCFVGQPCGDQTSRRDFTSNYVPPLYSGSVTVGTRLFDEKLTLGARTHFAGARAIERYTTTHASTDWAPYVVWDLFGSFKAHERLEVNASVENLTDLYYLDALSSVGVPSPGRRIKVGATLRF